MFEDIFIERLKRIFGEDICPLVLNTLDLPRPLSVRINTLKIALNEAEEYLTGNGFAAEKIGWFNKAFIIQGIEPQEFSRLDVVSQGKIYMQSLSSMLPVLILDPQPGEDVLDLCAAPGSKTTQMAAQMENQGNIVAVEAVRPRFYRLKSVLELLGVKNVQAKCVDARRFRTSGGLFDKILVDVPCSSESRFRSSEPETFAYWSPRKIKEMVQKQRGLLLNACRLLKPGGVLVYSTCTFAPEENEGVIDWLLRKMPEGMDLQEIELKTIKRYPSLLQWEKRSFDPRVERCFRVFPTDVMEGFFMAKIVRGNG